MLIHKKGYEYQKRILEKVPLFRKVLFLILMGIVFFFGDIFANEQYLVIYFCFQLIIFFLVCYICKIIIGSRVFWLTIKLWSWTAILYFSIVVPLTFIGVSISPWLESHNPLICWLHNISYPFRLLGIMFSGLTFIGIISPLEFLKYGQIGLYMALFFRIIEYGKETFLETIDALQMNGIWPDDKSKFHQIKYILLKGGPNLVIVTFRNMILFFIPWGWINFNQIKNNIKGDLK